MGINNCYVQKNLELFIIKLGLLYNIMSIPQTLPITFIHDTMLLYHFDFNQKQIMHW